MSQDGDGLGWGVRGGVGCEGAGRDATDKEVHICSQSANAMRSYFSSNSFRCPKGGLRRSGETR